MSRTITNPPKANDQEQLRRELLRLIVKSEAQRRVQSKAGEK